MTALERQVLDQIFRETAQQLRDEMRGEAFAVGVADDGEATRLVYQAGFADDHALEARLRPAWQEARAGGRVVVTRSPAGVELTAPMGAAAAVGALTVLADDLESPERLEAAQQVVATLAAQAAAAIAHARLAQRVERTRRHEAIGAVAAGVAHELRNPLFAISSAVQLLRFRAQQDPVVERNVGRILREVERLNRLASSLLDYGRPDPAQLAPGDPDAVWDEVLEANRGLLESRSLVLVRTRAEPHARCALDAGQLAQLLAHVLVNAVDAAPPASDLTLASTRLRGGAWRCRLHNGGAPVPPELLPRVFEPFVSGKPGGTGIGLALCERIAAAHHGTIALESTAARGTTVTIELPAA
jgi:signal transduction histidine kinase